MNKQFCPYCMTPITEGEACSNCGLTAGSYTPNRNHLPPGTVLNDRYLIGRALGSGGFGITYIGCDLRLELKVAIKEYFPTDKVQRISDVSLEVSVPSDLVEQSFQSGKDRFLEEARVMARMDKQPEIVSVRDFFECNNTAYIVMEYVEGTTFKQLVSQRGSGIPPQELFPMLKPLFGALTNLHEMGLIHRDISPDNLMMENGRIRLIDFGCARQPEKGEVTMTIILKHGYAPIEQYTNRGQGPWTDVYALSSTIYFCLMGKTPPRSIDRALDDELILPRKLGVPLTEEQEQALITGMGVTRRQRFSSVAELYAALYQAADPDPEPVRVALTAQAVCSGRADLSGFVYELQDEDGQVLKTCCTDSHGKAQFHLTVNKDMAGGTYTYHLQQRPGEPQDVEYLDQKCQITMSVRLRENQLKVTLQKDGEPVMPDDPFRFVNHLKAELDENRTVVIEPEKPEKKTGRKNKKLEMALLGGAAVIVALCLLMLPKWLGGNTEEPAPGPGAEVSAETEIPVEDLPMEQLPENPFEGCRLVTDNETDLAGLFDLSSVPSISLRDCSLSINQPLPLTKHVRVEEGASLVISQPVTIPAGVVLEVEGTLHLGETLTVEQGGFLHLIGRGHIEGGTVVFDHQREALSGSDPAAITRTVTADSRPYFFNLQMPLIDQYATHVTSVEELIAACEATDTQAIVIDADLYLEQDVGLSVPTVISPDVTVTTYVNHDNDDYRWLAVLDGGRLINYGRLEGALQLDSGEGLSALVVNHGELDVRGYLNNQAGAIINHGAMASSELIQIFHGSRLYNLGRMEVLTGDLNACGGEYRNLGETEISRMMEVSSGGHFSNDGTTIVQPEGFLYNTAYTINVGTIQLLAEAHLSNEGILELGAGEIVQEDGCIVENNSILQMNDLRLGENMPGHAVFFNDFPWDTGKEERYVRNEQELRTAAEDENVGCIIVDMPIEVQQHLDLDKNLIVDSQLTLDGHTHLTLRGTVQVNGVLEGGTASIEGGNLINNGQLNFRSFRLGNEQSGIGGQLLNYGQLQLQDDRLELHWDSALINYGQMRGIAETLIGSGSVLANRGNMDLTNGFVQVDGLLLLISGQDAERTDLLINSGAGFRVYGGWLGMTNGTILTIEDGAFLDMQQSTWNIDKSVEVHNHGNISVFGYNENSIQILGSYRNYGRSDVGIPIHLDWLLENEGEFRLHQTSDESLVLYGPNGLIEGNPLLPYLE